MAREAAQEGPGGSQWVDEALRLRAGSEGPIAILSGCLGPER
jgi:hypothetical protein